jgi:ABC-2 type transport system ATP-binding protein
MPAAAQQVDIQKTARELAAGYRATIEDLVGENRIQEALNRLQDCVRSLAPSLKDPVLMLLRRHSQFRRERIEGTTKGNEEEVIVKTILDILNEAETVARVVSEYDIAETAPPAKTDNAGKPALRLISAAPAIESDVADVAPETAPGHGEGELTLDENLRVYWRGIRDNRPPDETVAFSCQGISKGFRGSRFHLDDLSFSLRAGQITGVVGRNASGKTTLLRIVRGEIAPDRGQTAYPMLTRDSGSWSHVCRQIAYIPQFPGKWSGKVGTNLSYIAAAYGIRGNRNRELVEWYIQRYGLAEYQKCRWSELSGGFRMRYELARALVCRPKLLVLDEPLASLDVLAQQEFLKNLRAIAYSLEQPVPIIITSQHLYEVEAIADQMIILDGGNCLYCGALEDLNRNSSLRLFELNTFASKRTVQALLKKRQLSIVETTVDGYIVSCPLDVLPNAAMEYMMGAFGDQLIGVRDITGSSRRFFVNAAGQ